MTPVIRVCCRKTQACRRMRRSFEGPNAWPLLCADRHRGLPVLRQPPRGQCCDHPSSSRGRGQCTRVKVSDRAGLALGRGCGAHLAGVHTMSVTQLTGTLSQPPVPQATPLRHLPRSGVLCPSSSLSPPRPPGQSQPRQGGQELREGPRSGWLRARPMARPQEPTPGARPAAPPGRRAEPRISAPDGGEAKSAAARFPEARGLFQVCVSAAQASQRGERREARTVGALTFGRCWAGVSAPPPPRAE